MMTTAYNRSVEQLLRPPTASITPAERQSKRMPVPESTGHAVALTCSFCSTALLDVPRRFAGRNAWICGDCVDRFHAVTPVPVRTPSPGAPADTDSIPPRDVLAALVAAIDAAIDVNDLWLLRTEDICAAFDADRLTIYQATPDRTAIVSRVKMGLHLFKDIRLPVSDRSVSGYCAMTLTPVNITDAYDDAALASLSPNLQFRPDVDRLTGYRTRQMLVVPVVDPSDGLLAGIMQFINTRNDQPFPAAAERGAAVIAEAVARAFRRAPAVH